jgi:hypothetical protein
MLRLDLLAAYGEEHAAEVIPRRGNATGRSALVVHAPARHGGAELIQAIFLERCGEPAQVAIAIEREGVDLESAAARQTAPLAGPVAESVDASACKAVAETWPIPLAVLSTDAEADDRHDFWPETRNPADSPSRYTTDPVPRHLAGSPTASGEMGSWTSSM